MQHVRARARVHVHIEAHHSDARARVNSRRPTKQKKPTIRARAPLAACSHLLSFVLIVALLYRFSFPPLIASWQRLIESDDERRLRVANAQNRERARFAAANAHNLQQERQA